MNDKIELLKNIELFARLNDDELNIVGQHSEFYNFNQGDVIFKEGNYGDGLYIVKDGKVLITKQTDEDKEIDIALYIQGESFGELDLLENSPATATAHAHINTTLLVFPTKGIPVKDVFQKHPEISARILHILIAIIAGRIRSTNTVISEKKPWVQNLKKQLFNDKLTGLYNRTYLDEEFPMLLQDDNKTSLIMIKPDNFKDINDTYGHETGDRVLRLLADTIKFNLRKNDIAVRYRGDEYAAILPDSGTDTAIEIAKKLNSSIRELNIQHLTNGNEFQITISVGVSTFPEYAKDSNSLTQKAFDKMFEAREKGGDRILSVA